MNKYELTVVLNVKLEDDQRAAALEKVKGYITRFGGTVTDIDEWGKKRLAYEIQKAKEAFYYFIKDFMCILKSIWHRIRVIQFHHTKFRIVLSFYQHSQCCLCDILFLFIR